MFRFMWAIGIALSLAMVACSASPKPGGLRPWPSWPDFDKVSKEIARKYKQQYLSSGGGLAYGEHNMWAYSVRDNRNMTLDQAKTLAADMLHTTWEIVRKKPYYADDLRRHFEDHPSKVPSALNPTFFGFRVGFWDKNTDRPQPPYIAQILAGDGWVSFYLADPKTQALQEPPVLKMSYEELLKLVRKG